MTECGEASPSLETHTDKHKAVTLVTLTSMPQFPHWENGDDSIFDATGGTCHTASPVASPGPAFPGHSAPSGVTFLDAPGPRIFLRYLSVHPAGSPPDPPHLGALQKPLPTDPENLSCSTPPQPRPGWRELPFQVGTSKSLFKEKQTHLGTNVGARGSGPSAHLQLCYFFSSSHHLGQRGSVAAGRQEAETERGMGSWPRDCTLLVGLSCTSASSPDKWATLTSCQTSWSFLILTSPCPHAWATESSAPVYSD